MTTSPTPDPWCTADRHGATTRQYRSGCRCTPARAANAAYQHHKRHQPPTLIPALGTRRRLQALAAAGWSLRQIAAHLYVSHNTVATWRTQPRISVRNANRVAALYDDIGLTEGGNTRARNQAAGWPAPIEWGDNIDDPAAKPLNLDRPERGLMPLEDLRLLAHSGGTWRSMAARFGVQPASVIRAVERTGDTTLYELIARTSEHDNVKNRAA